MPRPPAAGGTAGACSRYARTTCSARSISPPGAKKLRAREASCSRAASLRPGVRSTLFPDLADVLDDPLIPEVAQGIGIDTDIPVPFEEEAFFVRRHVPRDARANDEEEVPLARGDGRAVPIDEPEAPIFLDQDVRRVDIGVAHHQGEGSLPQSGPQLLGAVEQGLDAILMLAPERREPLRFAAQEAPRPGRDADLAHERRRSQVERLGAYGVPEPLLDPAVVHRAQGLPEDAPLVVG